MKTKKMFHLSVILSLLAIIFLGSACNHTKETYKIYVKTRINGQAKLISYKLTCDLVVTHQYGAYESNMCYIDIDTINLDKTSLSKLPEVNEPKFQKFCRDCTYGIYSGGKKFSQVFVKAGEVIYVFQKNGWKLASKKFDFEGFAAFYADFSESSAGNKFLGKDAVILLLQ